jgi:hypothetical protein
MDTARRPFPMPRRTITFILAVSAGAGLGPAALRAGQAPYRRGDSNASGEVDISDPLYLLNFLFSGGPPPRCRAEADANASGAVDISDAVALLNYLFSGVGDLPPLTAEEEGSCAEPWVVRSGTLVGVLPFVNEERGVQGTVEQLSNRTIRVRNFYYDGGGGGRTYIWLHRGGDMRTGRPISPSIRRPYPGFVNETIEYPIPDEITDDMFHSVAVWCYDFDLNFGSGRMFPPSP